LALLLKINPAISEVVSFKPIDSVKLKNIKQLGLYDIINTPGVASDLSHIASPAKVEGYLPGNNSLAQVLAGADIVVIPASAPRKPGVDLLCFPVQFSR